jgi:PadR family transcriptional regulator PadR
MRVERELMRGAGPAAVLRLLEGGERYGYELVKLLDARSDGVLAMGQSTLYPLLYNLEAKGLIASRVVEPDGKAGGDAPARARRYYRLTEKGKRQLARERKQWEALSVAMGKLGVIGG